MNPKPLRLSNESYLREQHLTPNGDSWRLKVIEDHELRNCCKGNERMGGNKMTSSLNRGCKGSRPFVRDGGSKELRCSSDPRWELLKCTFST